MMIFTRVLFYTLFSWFGVPSSNQTDPKTVALARFERVEKCGANATYVSLCARSMSANQCYLNCLNYRNFSKPECSEEALPKGECNPGCDCAPGLVFRYGNFGDCILPEECPQFNLVQQIQPKIGKRQVREVEEKEPFQKPKCGANSFVAICYYEIAQCHPNCGNTMRGNDTLVSGEQHPSCNQNLVCINYMGCRCVDGYVSRDASNVGDCIHPAKCSLNEDVF